MRFTLFAHLVILLLLHDLDVVLPLQNVMSLVQVTFPCQLDEAEYPPSNYPSRPAWFCIASLNRPAPVLNRLNWSSELEARLSLFVPPIHR